MCIRDSSCALISTQEPWCPASTQTVKLPWVFWFFVLAADQSIPAEESEELVVPSVCSSDVSEDCSEAEEGGLIIACPSTSSWVASEAAETTAGDTRTRPVSYTHLPTVLIMN